MDDSGLPAISGRQVVRVVMVVTLVVALMMYSVEFKLDQELEGEWGNKFHEKVTNAVAEYPGHRGNPGFIFLFVSFIVFGVVACLAAWFEHLLVLCIFILCWPVLVIVDFIYLGLIYTKLGFWAGPGSMALGLLTEGLAIGYAVMLFLQVGCCGVGSGGGDSNADGGTDEGGLAGPKSTKGTKSKPVPTPPGGKKKRKDKKKKKKQQPTNAPSAF